MWLVGLNVVHAVCIGVMENFLRSKSMRTDNERSDTEVPTLGCGWHRRLWTPVVALAFHIIIKSTLAATAAEKRWRRFSWRAVMARAVHSHRW